MAGLYIHIPFCRTKCAYCDFFSVPLSAAVSHICGHSQIGGAAGRTAALERYVGCVLEEFSLRRHELPERIETIYVGGGTPTALPGSMLENLIEGLRAQLDSTPIEVTVEANPEDISSDRIEALRGVGVNRISIGVQSFDSQQLRAAGRHHSAEASIQALHILSDSGINYSADLIYGLPTQNVDSWREQLERLLAFRPNHLSSYLLSYEPGTTLTRLRDLGKVEETDEEVATRMYEILCELTKNAGYEHYEISNFSLPGYHSRHNSSYWNLTPYLGLGCSAHSFDGSIRRYNPAELHQYVKSLEAHQSPAVVDEENLIDKINDYIITSLRTTDGLSLSLMEQRWGATPLRDEFDNSVSLVATFLKKAEPFLADNRLISTQHHIAIPERHWLTADSILRDLLLD